METLRLGIPKGSLEESTLGLFHQVGLEFRGGSRSLKLSSSDDEIEPLLLRPQEIPIYVRDGRLDAGLAGKDWIYERGAERDVHCLVELQYSKQTTRPIRWVLAVPDESKVLTVDDLRAECQRRAEAGEDQYVISTELVQTADYWLARNGIDARTEFSWGATEGKAGYLAQAIIEATETGASLEANGLRIVATVFESRTWLFANTRSLTPDTWMRHKLEGIAHLLKGALRASDHTQLTVLWLDAPQIRAIEEVLPLTATMSYAVPNGEGRLTTVFMMAKADVPQVMPKLMGMGAERAWLTPVDMSIDKSD